MRAGMLVLVDKVVFPQLLSTGCLAAQKKEPG
jgi:hypothetical protein